MGNEYYGAPTTPTSDYLAHYGIKGMKWGVRKAIASGNTKALSRQYAKAEKKLAKLEKRAASGKKYAKRAAALGAGAAAAGGLAAAGTTGVGRLVGGVGGIMQEAGYGANRLAGKYIKNNKVKTAIKTAGAAVGKAGTSVKGAQIGINKWGKGRHDIATAASNIGGKYGQAAAGNKVASELRKRGMGSVSNNTLARIGAGAVGAGLAGAAGYNAYRAATTKRAAKKAAQFRSEMNKAFAGTKYANGNPNGGKKKRRK